MQLTEENIIEFQKIYKKYFGIEISKEKAYEEGAKLVRLMQLIYKPMTKVKDRCLREQNGNVDKR